MFTVLTFWIATVYNVKPNILYAGTIFLDMMLLTTINNIFGKKKEIDQ